MKKFTAFLLALMMLMGILFIGINAEEANQEDTECSCGGSYGAWEAQSTEIYQIRYTRKCDCGKVQTAKDITPKTISYTMPAIGANTGDTVFLSLYSVYFESNELVSADSITWSSSSVEIVDNQICLNTAGVYELTATSGTKTKSVYLIVKNPTDTEYVLFFDNFDRDPNGDGNADEQVNVPTDADATKNDYAIVQQPSGTSAYFQNGKLVLDTLGNANNQMRVLLPKWIGVFGDYKIDTVFTIDSTVGNDQSRWFATMARVGNSSSYFPIWQAAVRKGAQSYYNSGNRGVEVSYTENGTNWTVPYYTKYTENIDATKYYTQTFDIVGTEASHAINGTTLLDTRNYTGKKKPSSSTVGYVGFHLRASLVYVDSIKIVVPIEDATHSFTSWETITAATCLVDGLEKRTCNICGTVEERVIKGEHKLVQHSAKLPTCTENGYKSYEECSVCDHTTFKGYIPAFGHCYDREFHSVAHRGASSVAPENTLPAYEAAHKLGFIYVECDVMFTSDGVAVLSHDKLDGVSNGTGSVINYTYEELLKLDFGSWKGEEFAGTKIATFEEFIVLCAKLGLHPYIELKNNGGITQERVNALVATVEEYSLIDNCSWIAFSHTYLGYVKNADPTARLGYLYSNTNFANGNVNTAINLRNGQNEVFLDLSHTLINNSKYYDVLLYAMENNMPIAAWTVDDEATMKKLTKYVTGVASNKLYSDGYFFNLDVTEPTCVAQGYTTYTCACGATKVDDYVPATGNHTAKDGVCTECNAIVYCNNDSHNLEIISISYANGYDKEGVKVVRCLDCDASQTETKASPLFTCVGFSVPEDGRGGITLSFSLDNDAISEYETVTGKTLKYGVFAVAESKIGNNSIFDENGNVFNGAICADVTEYEFNMFDIKIVGFSDDHKSLPLAMGAYISVTEGSTTEYSYIQNSSPNKDEIYSFISYNDIVNPKEVIQ